MLNKYFYIGFSEASIKKSIYICILQSILCTNESDIKIFKIQTCRDFLLLWSKYWMMWNILSLQSNAQITKYNHQISLGVYFHIFKTLNILHSIFTSKYCAGLHQIPPDVRLEEPHARSLQERVWGHLAKVTTMLMMMDKMCLFI